MQKKPKQMRLSVASTHSFGREAEQAVREVDEDAIGHDALHPAHHHHPDLQLGERRNQAFRLQSRDQRGLLTENLCGFG